MYKLLVRLLRRRTTIKFRIYLFAGVMLSLFYFASIFSFVTHLNDVKAEKRKSLNFVVSELLTKTAGQGLRRGTRDQLDSVIETLIQSTEIKSIKVYDTEGDLFTKNKNIENGSNNIVNLEVDIVWKKLAAQFGELDLDSESVSDSSQVIGKIIVEVDEGEISGLVWSAMMEKSYALLIAVLLSIPIVYVLAMSLVRPLRGIMDDLKRFENGEFSHKRIKGKYRDEYASLSRALEKAGESILKKTEEIEEANKDLKSYSAELESQVRIAIEARKAADEASARKDIFVANMTHEFKRPLTGIVSGLILVEHCVYEVLSEIDEMDLGNNNDRSEKISLKNIIFRTIKSLDTVKLGSYELEQSVNEILISIQEINEEIILNERPIRLLHSVAALLSHHQPYAEHKGLYYKTSVSNVDEIAVITDWVRVAQIVNALIDNAIQFTLSGGIEISVKIEQAEEKVKLTVEVIDTGIGISDSEKEAIFNLFHIGQHPRSKLGSGIGTGLAIARSISEKLGGKIYLKSSENKLGSSFTFECDFDVCKDTQDIIDSEDGKTIERKERISILYVEDSPVSQMIFQQFCLQYNVDLVTATNGPEGLEKYSKGKFDALVVDCYMPLGDGFEMVSEIRKREEAEGLNRSLIFALSADDSAKNIQRCYRYGFDEFVAKPYTAETYNHILDKLSDYSKND